MKVMKSKSMIISVQCQTQFSKEIWAKYSWSYSQGNHVRLQHKEDVVQAKQAPPAMPKVTIQHIVQPLYIKLALQHLSFSQLAVYKQQLLREASAVIAPLQASAVTEETQVLQPTQVTKAVHAPNRGAEAHSTSTSSTRLIEQAKQIIIQEKQSIPAWVQLKHVAQHFKQDRFLQAIIDKRSTVVHYKSHMQHIDHVVAQGHALEAEVASLSASQSLEHNAARIISLEKTPARLDQAVSKTSEATQQAEAAGTQPIARAQVKHPVAVMIWHERVQERQQQWNREQEELLRKSQAVLQHSDNQLIHKKEIQQLVRHDLLSYMSSQHMNVTTNQMIQLKKIRVRDVTQKALKRIEQRLTKEHITLHYAEHTVKRKRGRPKKENNQLDQERQAVTHHIHRNRKMASVLKVVEVQAGPSYSDTTTTQAAHIQVKVKSSTNISQLANIPNSKKPNSRSLVIHANNSVQHLEKHDVQLSSLTERRIISVSEQWLTKIKSKEQLTSLSLIHLTKRVSEDTNRNVNDEAKISSNYTKLSDVASKQSNGDTKPSNVASKQSNGDTKLSDVALKQSNGDTKPSDIASKQSNGDTKPSDVALGQSSEVMQQSDAASIHSSNQASAQYIDADGALHNPATAHTRNEMELQKQSQPEEKRLAEANELRIINRQLQAKIEHVHIHSPRWLQSVLTKQKPLAEVQAVQRYSTNENKPLLQARWQHKLASQQTALLNKLQEHVNVMQQRKAIQEVVHNHAEVQQAAVIIHTQSKQVLTLTSGRTISITTRAPLGGARLQKLASNERQHELIRRVLAQQELTYKDRQEIVSDPINHGEHNIKSIVTQPMPILHRANHRTPAGLNVAKLTAALSATKRQLEQTNVQPATMRQLDRANVQRMVTKDQLVQPNVQRAATMHQHGGTNIQLTRPMQQLVRTNNEQRAAMMNQHGGTNEQRARTMNQLDGTNVQRAATLHQHKHSAALPAVMRQTESTKDSSMLDARIHYAASTKSMRSETARQDAYPEHQIAHPISLKRVELDTVTKHVSLLVKDEKKVQQKQHTEPIAVMQTHIKKLEEQIQQQQQLLLDVRNPMAIKQLSNQIYDELSRKIKFDRQRLGR